MPFCIELSPLFFIFFFKQNGKLLMINKTKRKTKINPQFGSLGFSCLSCTVFGHVWLYRVYIVVWRISEFEVNKIPRMILLLKKVYRNGPIGKLHFTLTERVPKMIT